MPGGGARFPPRPTIGPGTGLPAAARRARARPRRPGSPAPSGRRGSVGGLRAPVAAELPPRQREVFVAVVLHEVPADVLAERLGSTRGAIYKMVHYARRRLWRGVGA